MMVYSYGMFLTLPQLGAQNSPVLIVRKASFLSMFVT